MKNSAPPKSQAMSLFFAGLLPVIAFTLIEEYYGVIAGLIAGMVFGAGEVIFELYKYKKIQKMTLIGNGLLLGLGAVSLVSSEGVWFKLQPALMEGLFVLVLWFSILMGKPLLSYMAEQQGHQLPEIVKQRMKGITFRTGLFFAIQTVLAVWAALYWSTTAWALLKGVGLTVSFVLYLLLEVFLLRRKIVKSGSNGGFAEATHPVRHPAD